MSNYTATNLNSANVPSFTYINSMNIQQPIVFTTTSGLGGGVLNELNTSNLINTENLQIPIIKEHNYASVFFKYI